MTNEGRSDRSRSIAAAPLGLLAFVAANVVLTSGENEAVIAAGIAFNTLCDIVALMGLGGFAGIAGWRTMRFLWAHARAGANYDFRWPPFGPRLATVLVTAGGVAAGEALVAPICYLQGRLSLGLRPRSWPMAWSPEAAPLQATAFAMGMTWVAFAAFHIRAVVRAKRSVFLILFPLFAVGWYALFSARLSYACNTF